MKTTDIIRRAGRSLKQAKARTLLTSLAIAVGAFTITLSLAAGEGGRQYAQDIVSSNTDVRAVYVQKEATDEGIDPSQPQEYNDDPTINYGGGFDVPLLTQQDIKTLEGIEGVESVAPMYGVAGKYITRDNQKQYTVGIETFDPAIQQEYVAGSSDSLTKNEVVIPNNYREVLGFDTPQAAIGQTIQIAVEKPATLSTPAEDVIREYTVAGVTEPSTLAVAVGGGNVQLTQEAVAQLYRLTTENSPNEDTFMGAIVLTANESEAAAVKDRIAAAGNYTGQTAEDAMSFIFQFINVLQGILIGFGALAVVTAVFGIINTQYISVLERTQQIGLMKALGMKRREVGRLFKLEAAWIGFLGGLLGSGAAFIAGTIGNPFISEALNLEDARLLVFQPLSIVVIVVGLMLVSVLAGILPARKAAKLDPIEALRTE